MTVPDLDAIRERLEVAEAEGWYGFDEEARSDVRALLAEIERLRQIVAECLIGRERPPESVFEEFRELHGLAAQESAE